MKKIDENRLIELAQGISESTAEELRLIEHDEEIAREYAELSLLFNDLKELPEPELDEGALRSILPSVRQSIQEKQDKSLLSSILTLPRPALNFLTAAASIIVIIAMFLMIGSVSDPFESYFDAGFDFTSAGLDSPFNSIDTLQLEASLIGDINIYGDLESSLSERLTENIYEDETASLIDSATDLDDNSFESLVKRIKNEGN